MNLEKLRMKVVSDGTIEGTRVYDKEGKEIGLVQECIVRYSVDDISPEMVLVIAEPKMDVEIPIENVKIIREPIYELGNPDPVGHARGSKK